ncbi:hypothetical protein M422DRAFT_245704 [Sphaerobolus stellatus SS14]|nr:hypothetical protein M422DRAFT_245704 [Sphaerobolus stellatus SS14]
MLYHQPISDKQLAPFLEAAKLMTIPENEASPVVAEEVPVPSTSQNERILKELWYCETAIAVYSDVKRKAEEAETKRKAEEAAVKKAAEEEDERAMDVNLEGEDEVDQDETPKSKLKSKKTKLHLIVDSESEEKTEEVKAKRRKGKGKGKAVDPEYKRNTVPVDYAGCPGFPAHKMCEGCKVLANAKYQRPCMGDVQMDANNQIFYVRSKDYEVNFIMPEAADDKELQAKLKKLCNEQDTFRTQKEKEKAERNKLLENSMKAGTKKKVQVNMKASGSTLKVVSEEDDIEVTSQPKRARTVANNDGSIERILSVAESLHYINKALMETVNILGDTQAASEKQAKYLRGIETCMANLQSAMQMHVGPHWPSPLPFGGAQEPAGPEDMEEEVKEVHEEVEEVRKEDKEGREVEDDETMKDPEADEL